MGTFGVLIVTAVATSCNGLCFRAFLAFWLQGIKNMGKGDEVTNNTKGVRVGLIAMEFKRTRVISIGDRTFSLPLSS